MPGTMSVTSCRPRIASSFSSLSTAGSVSGDGAATSIGCAGAGEIALFVVGNVAGAIGDVMTCGDVVATCGTGAMTWGAGVPMNCGAGAAAMGALGCGALRVEAVASAS